MDNVMREAGKLASIPVDVALEYEDRKDIMMEDVNHHLTSHPDIGVLLGQNPLAVMYDNHRNHAMFMVNVFKLNAFELLAKTLVWVYRSYHARGFSYDYFSLELNAWLQAAEKHLTPSAAKAVGEIYQWMLDSHKDMVVLSQVPADPFAALNPAFEDKRRLFLAALLRGDSRECLRQGSESATSKKSVEDFYLQVVQPSLYAVGTLWETGDISVAQEHLASALVARVMAAVVSPLLELITPPRGGAVITAAPNEHHELGAWMVADFFRMDGWDVHYLGSNTPEADLLKFLSDVKPFLVCVSVAMSFNLEKAQQLIASMKADPALKDIRVLIGGYFFQSVPDLWKITGADGWAIDAAAAAKTARDWRTKDQQ